MRVRPLLIMTAIVSAILGAVVAYLVLTVPNDVEAAALMRQARKDITAGRSDAARNSLAKIVQQYPRTDAAAAATVALVKLADDDRVKLQRELDALKREQSRQIAVVNQMQTTIDDVKNAPPKVVEVQKIVPAPPAKKAPARRKHTRRHR
jgi:predicted RND superfamily exporter protein